MLYVIPDILLKVALTTNKTGHQVIHYHWSHIAESGFNINKTGYHVIPNNWHIVERQEQLTTNKTGHHVIHYPWPIVESGAKHQLNWSRDYTSYLTHCWQWW
jgi:hypothetical protein